MGGAVAETARRYVEFDGDAGPRKRRRTSFSTTVDDEEVQDDTEAMDAQVSCDVSTLLCWFLRIYKQLQVEEPRQPSPLSDDQVDLTEGPEPSGSRPRRNAQPPMRF